MALTLRAVGGLTTREIADAFYVPEGTMAQRITGAKRTLNLHDLDARERACTRPYVVEGRLDSMLRGGSSPLGRTGKAPISGAF